MADGGGFEPPVPFGTHAFQACTIDRSVTHPGKLAVLARNRNRARAREQTLTIILRLGVPLNNLNLLS